MEDNKVPYIVFEGEQARHERTVKRLVLALLVSIALLFLSIEEWILNEKYRGILKRRLLDGITFEKIAEEFEMSPRQIKRIVYKSQAGDSASC